MKSARMDGDFGVGPEGRGERTPSLPPPPPPPFLKRRTRRARLPLVVGRARRRARLRVESRGAEWRAYGGVPRARPEALSVYASQGARGWRPRSP